MSKIKILSIDGGGIRGILPGVVLAYVESQLQKKSENPQARLADYFDMMAGTSTGGILTCIYLCPDKDGRPKYSAQEAVNLYLKKGESIFSRTLKQRIRSVDGVADEKYSAVALEENIKAYLGETKLSEMLRPCLITSYDIEQRRAHFFTSHDAESDIYDYHIKDVARATSAAPTYFECARIENLYGSPFALVDGGVFANNPALCAYSEARMMTFTEKNISKPKAKDMIVVSIGTGSKPPKYEYKKAKDYGMVEWIQPVIDIMMSGNSETVDFQLKMLFEAADASDQYFRIKPEVFSADNQMDNASAENLKALEEAGLRSVTENKAQLDRLVDMLMTEKKGDSA